MTKNVVSNAPKANHKLLGSKAAYRTVERSEIMETENECETTVKRSGLKMTEAIEQEGMPIDTELLMPETSKFSPRATWNTGVEMPPSPDSSENLPVPAETCVITNDLCNFDLQAGVSLIYPTNFDNES